MFSFITRRFSLACEQTPDRTQNSVITRLPIHLLRLVPFLNYSKKYFLEIKKKNHSKHFIINILKEEIH